MGLDCNREISLLSFAYTPNCISDSIHMQRHQPDFPAPACFLVARITVDQVKGERCGSVKGQVSDNVSLACSRFIGFSAQHTPRRQCSAQAKQHSTLCCTRRAARFITPKHIQKRHIFGTYITVSHDSSSFRESKSLLQTALSHTIFAFERDRNGYRTNQPRFRSSCRPARSTTCSSTAASARRRALFKRSAI